MKIFLAGTYSQSKIVDDIFTSKYNLESFFYLKSWQIPLINASDMFFLDSGAFTFFNSGKKVVWEDYIERYCEFIKENKIKYFFELDVDSIVGYDRVLGFRKTIERLTGKQVIPVWHKSRGFSEFKRMCDEYPYVAIGGIASKEIKQNQYGAFPHMIDEAHKRGAKVHGLGFTKVSRLKEIRFDSVDSTRWNCGRFGRIEYFDGKTMRVIDRRKIGKRIKKDIHSDVLRFTLGEWVKFQRYADANL